MSSSISCIFPASTHRFRVRVRIENGASAPRRGRDLSWRGPLEAKPRPQTLLGHKRKRGKHSIGRAESARIVYPGNSLSTCLRALLLGGLPMRHKCHACKKKFRTEGALAMHARDKHPDREAPIIRQPKSGMLGLVGAFVAGICLGALATSASSELGAGISQANYIIKAVWSR